MNCYDFRVLADLAAPPGGPELHEVVVGVMRFTNERSCQCVILIEMMIDFDVELPALVRVDIFSVSACRPGDRMAGPPVHCGIQAIDGHRSACRANLPDNRIRTVESVGVGH